MTLYHLYHHDAQHTAHTHTTTQHTRCLTRTTFIRVEQRAALMWHDQVATAVAQSQQPLRSGMYMRSGDGVNATLFPLWSAGLTGAGMVVGIGDSGLGTLVHGKKKLKIKGFMS